MSDANKLSRIGWGFQLDPDRKGHVIAKRVWETKEKMMAYLYDHNSSAVPGLILVVTNDPNEENNCAYLVKHVSGVDGYNLNNLTEEIAVVPLATGKIEKVQLLTTAENEDILNINDNYQISLDADKLKQKIMTWEETSF